MQKKEEEYYNKKGHTVPLGNMPFLHLLSEEDRQQQQQWLSQKVKDLALLQPASNNVVLLHSHAHRGKLTVPFPRTHKEYANSSVVVGNSWQ